MTVWNPEGKLLGRIRLPETCANIAFGGPKRNRLFMCAGQSLYALYVNTQGASPARGTADSCDDPASSRMIALADLFRSGGVTFSSWCINAGDRR